MMSQPVAKRFAVSTCCLLGVWWLGSSISWEGFLLAARCVLVSSLFLFALILPCADKLVLERFVAFVLALASLCFEIQSAAVHFGQVLSGAKLSPRDEQQTLGEHDLAQLQPGGRKSAKGAEGAEGIKDGESSEDEEPGMTLQSLVSSNPISEPSPTSPINPISPINPTSSPTEVISSTRPTDTATDTDSASVNEPDGSKPDGSEPDGSKPDGSEHDGSDHDGSEHGQEEPVSFMRLRRRRAATAVDLNLDLAD